MCISIWAALSKNTLLPFTANPTKKKHKAATEIKHTHTNRKTLVSMCVCVFVLMYLINTPPPCISIAWVNVICKACNAPILTCRWAINNGLLATLEALQMPM